MFYPEPIPPKTTEARFDAKENSFFKLLQHAGSQLPYTKAKRRQGLLLKLTEGSA